MLLTSLMRAFYRINSAKKWVESPILCEHFSWIIGSRFPLMAVYLLPMLVVNHMEDQGIDFLQWVSSTPIRLNDYLVDPGKLLK